MHQQSESAPRRSYQKTKRAEDEGRTRARIVDAAEELHQTLGPARSSVSAIAEHAAVTRATVYRHFADEEALFLACSGQWMSRQRTPNPDAWTAHDDPLVRLRAGLTDIYRFYRLGEPMLTLVHRDADSVPARIKASRVQAHHRWVETLLQPFPTRRSKTLAAAIGHAAAFETWRSLCAVQGLSNRSAVSLLLGMVTVASKHPPTSTPKTAG